MSIKVQDALKAREERKKINKTDSAIEAYKKRKQLKVQSATTDIAKRINAEIDTIKAGSTSYWGTDAFKNTMDSTRESRLKIKELQQEIESYKNYFDEETYNKFSSTIDEINKSYDSYIEGSKTRSQWESEDAYNLWLDEYKKKEAEKQAVLGAEDFEHYSQIGASIENPSYSAANGTDNFLGWKNPFVKGEEIKNIVTFSRDNIEDITKALAGANNNADLSSALGDYRYQYLTEEEVAIYNYYLGKGETQKAEEYLTSLDDTLNQRWGGEISDRVEGNKFLEMTFAVNAGLDQFASGISNIDNLIMGTENDSTTATQYASSLIRENLDGGWGVAYDLISTTSNMLPSILVGSLTGGVGGAATMGVSAVGNGYAEMRQLGYDENQARTYGVLVGASEALLQYALGGISNLGGKVTGNAVTKLVSKFDNAIARTAIKIGGNMLSEGTEEAIQTVLEPAFKALATGEDFEAPEWEDVFYNALLGALSAGVLEGIPTIVGDSVNSNRAKKIYGNNISDLVTESLEIDSNNEHAQRMKTRLDNGKSVSGYQINRLIDANETTMYDQDVSAIQSATKERLSALGETGNVEEIAKILTKQAQGKKLTPFEKQTIKNSKYGQRVANELNTENIKSGQYSSAWTEQIETNRINAEEYGQALAGAEVVTDTKVENKTPKAISKSGKTTQVSTNEEITIDKNNAIKKTEIVNGERVVYLNTDHGEVKSSDINYANKDEALVYESFVDMNPAFANAVIKNYDGSVPIQTYINGMREGILVYGMHNFQAVGKDISKDSYLAQLSEADQNFALKLGRSYAKTDAKKAEAPLRKAIKNTDTNTTAKKGKVYFENGAKPLKKHKKTVTLAKHLANAIGINIAFYDATIAGTKHSDSNGYYDKNTNTIHLDLQNATSDAKTIAFTLSHELVHFIKDQSPSQFNTFASFLMEQYAEHEVDTSTLLANKMAELGTKDADYAYEEMIADACETLLLDSNAVYKLMELRKTDLSLFEKIKLHIHELLSKIRAEYKRLGLQPTSDEAKALLQMEDALEQIYAKFEDALVTATQNYQAVQNSNEIVFGEASIDMGKAESGVKHQLKAHKTIGEASIAYNERHKNVHKAILQVGVESMYEMAEAMLPYLEEEGILPPDIPGKTIFNNGSYGRTGENTTLCVRTLTYEDFKDRVAEKIGRPLTVSESLLVSQKIYDIATEPQCIYCYVAADRKAYDDYLGEYWKAMDKYIKALRKGGDSQALYTEYLAGRKDTNQQKKRWSQWEAIAKSGKEYISAKDLTTKRKRDEIIAKRNAFSEQIKDAQRYAQSASWAKTVFDYRAYKGDILKMSVKFVDMLNGEYGLRMYSFSDYTPAFIVENMQMIIDASVKGLKSLAYTKDTDYVEIFASTGQAINVSCFAKWDAQLGTFVEDNRQGANWEKTKNLRKQYRNVGAVMVATNDAMVEWALKQDWVDVVIPYHIVKTGTTIANEYQWNNYTSESSDKIGSKGANIYPTEHNNDFATYSNLLNERGITPRFNRWYEKVASGELTEDQYMKLVNEVRLPASELSAVIPSFNLEAAKKSFGIDNNGKVIEGGFVDKGGYMGGWYRQGVDVNQEVMTVSEDIKAGKSSLDVDYGMSKASKEKVEARYKKQAKKPISVPGTTKTLSEAFVNDTLNSFDIDNLSDFEQVQKRVFDTLVKEGFFSDTNPISRKDTNDETGMVIETNKSGIEETFCYENYTVVGRFKKMVKLATIRELPNAIKYGTLIADDVPNQYAPTKGTKFAYFLYETQVDGNDVAIKLTIRKSSQKNKFWVHGFEAIENVSGAPADTYGVKTGYKTTDIGDIISQKVPIVKKQLKKSSTYAPTFYSQMGKVIDDIKMDKIGATSVVNYLKGKGIKNDEIKWSGIEAFLEGKKSVTKSELQEFVAGSQLVIEEEMSEKDVDLRYDGSKRAYNLYDSDGNVIDTFTYNEFMDGYIAESDEEIYSNENELREAVRDVYGYASAPKWADYTLNGGTNYRELVFKMPNSSYSNRAMRTHWGQDAEGILVHARIQDFVVNGKKMLFIEELQSDWHNEGMEKGYTTKEYEDAVETHDALYDKYKKLDLAFHKYIRSNDFMTDPEDVRKKKSEWLRNKAEAAQKKYLEAEKVVNSLKEKGAGDTPNAPFRDTYHEYVLKRLLRMAAEEGYDSIGWTPADIQSKRWSYDYEKAYKIEYDQEMPKFLRKYGKRWGATVGTTYVNPVANKDKRIAEYERDIADNKRQINEILDAVGEMGIDTIADEQIQILTEDIKELQAGMEELNGTKIWSMDITESMAQSVLYEGQAKFQKKKLSNRTILSNALENSIDTSTQAGQNELRWLKNYQDKIALIESEEAHLAEVKAEIAEISFNKGTDRSKLKDLNADKNRTANRITTYDKQLMRLEAMKPIKDVLAREKEMVRKRTEEKGREMLKAVRERDAKTLREVMNRNQESRKKAIDSRHRTEMRHKIHKIVSELNQTLLDPTKEKHVPIGLQKPVAEALAIINMDTVGAEERIAKYDALIAKAKDPDKIEALKKSRDNIELQGASLKDKLEALKNAYAAFVKSEDPLIRNAHNEAIENLIENTADKVGNTSLRNMSYEQLEAVYDMFKAIRATVRNANKMFKEGRQETVSENSSNVSEEIRKIGGHRNRELKALKAFKKYGWNMFKPITAMKVIGSETFENLFNNVRAGEDTWAVDISEAKEFFQDKAKQYDYWSWDFKKQYSFKDGTNRDFSLSLEQIMSLYAYSKRNQADRHLEVGGFVFDDAIEVTEKKHGIPLKYTVNDANPYRLNKEGIAEVISALTEEQKQFLDEMQSYLSDVMGAKGNEVSLAMYDIKLYNEKNYFPLKTAKHFREFNAEQSATPNLKNSGFSKKTVPQAGNPIVLSNFMDVWSSHVNDMSMYHAFVLPLEDFMRVYNYSSTAGGYDSVQQYIKNAYGSQANTYIETLLKDLNGGARVDTSADLVNKGISLFKKASVFASASVVIQQPSAMARAMAYINPKYFATNPHIINHKAEWAELKKYAPIAIIKEMGYFDTNVGKKTTDWITEREYEGIAQKSKAVFTDSGYRDELLSKAPAMADELSWAYIWEAVKKETKATTKLEGEELLKQAGKRFTEVIANTQVYDSVLSRSAMMRSKDTGMKMATAFMAEPTTVVNMMIDGIIQRKRGNKKFLASTVGAVSASIILNSILVSLVYAARDDDEDETYPEKYLGSITTELIDGFNPITYLPFAKDIWSIAQGYDVERSDMSVWSKLVESIESLFSETKSGWEKTEEVVGAISSLFGLPFKNILRDARGIYNLSSTLSNDMETTSQGISDAIEDSAKSSIPFWKRIEKSMGADESKSDKLYEAIMSGDQTHINRVKAQYATKQALTSAIRSALRENDTRIHEAAQARYNGDITTYKQIAKEIIAEERFSQDDVVAAINAEINAIKKGETSTESQSEDTNEEATSIYKASDVNSAFDNGDNTIALEIINELIDTKVSNGMTEKEAKSSLRSSMTSYWKPLYKEAYQKGDANEMQRIRYILFNSGLYGNGNEVVKTAQNWLKD